MNKLTELDYAFIMCFKRSQRDNAALLRRLMAEQAEWCGILPEYIGVNDVAHMINNTVGRLGLLKDEDCMHRWFNCMKTEALCDHISEYEKMAAIFDEFQTPDHLKGLASFYIRHILSFSDIIRQIKVDDAPGLKEYREANKHKWPIKELDNPEVG